MARKNYGCFEGFQITNNKRFTIVYNMNKVETTVVIFMLVITSAIAIRVMNKERYENLPEIGTRYVCPTRNQSYDIRGDLPIPRNDWQVNSSTIGPREPNLCVYNRLE